MGGTMISQRHRPTPAAVRTASFAIAKKWSRASLLGVVRYCEAMLVAAAAVAIMITNRRALSLDVIQIYFTWCLDAQSYTPSLSLFGALPVEEESSESESESESEAESEAESGAGGGATGVCDKGSESVCGREG